MQFTLFDDTDKGKLLLHAVNVQELEPFFKVGDFDISLKTDKPVRGVRLLPDNTEVAYTYEAGKLSFKVEDMDLYKMFEISYK